MTELTDVPAEAAGVATNGGNGDGTSEPDPRRWIALAVVLVAGFMDLLDVTIVNVAIPSILRDLNASYAQVEWVVAAYVLGFAALLITGGRLGDIYGRKRLFVIGVAGFTLASLLCGVAGSPEMLIVARFVEGAMAGLMVPQILAIIHASFPPEERGQAFGAWGGTLGMASVAGLVIGGLLVRWNPAGLEWRSIFLVNMPVGLAALVAAWLFVRESRAKSAPRPDLIGMALAAAGVVMLVYPLYEGRSLGWPAWLFALIAAGLGVLAVFVAYERQRSRTVGSPLVEMRLFRFRGFTVGLAAWALFWVALGGFFILWTLYMQVGLGWSPLHAGLTAAAFAVGAAAGSAMSVQFLVPRFGRRVLMAGALVNALSFAGYALLISHQGPSITSWQMLVPLLGSGFGFGLVVAAMVDLVLTDVPVQDAGSGSGLLTTLQQVGAALGVALAGVLFFALLAHGSGHGVDTVTPKLERQLDVARVAAPNQQRIVAGLRVCVHDRSAATDPTKVPASCRAASGAAASSPQAGQARGLLVRAEVRANAHNFARTFSTTLWFAVGILVLVFLAMFALPSSVHLRDLDELAATAR
jgi:EmrB/QacA subfamily drug resistance transporter